MARNSSTQVVCDAGPIIHLDELGCLDLLADFDLVLVPEGVCQEIARHRPEALDRDGIQFAHTQHIRPSLLDKIIERVQNEFDLD